MTRFSVTDTDGAGAGAGTIVSAITSNTAPVLSGSAAQQLTTTDLAISPFPSLMLTDPDFSQTETLSLGLTTPPIGNTVRRGRQLQPVHRRI